VSLHAEILVSRLPGEMRGVGKTGSMTRKPFGQKVSKLSKDNSVMSK
jgi:hypothetical protein